MATVYSGYLTEQRGKRRGRSGLVERLRSVLAWRYGPTWDEVAALMKAPPPPPRAAAEVRPPP